MDELDPWHRGRHRDRPSRPTTMTTVPVTHAGEPVMCRCGHTVLAHHITPSHKRAYCTHMDPAGACTCVRAEPLEKETPSC